MKNTRTMLLISLGAGMIAMLAFTAGAYAASDGGVFGDINTEFTVERVMGILTGLVCWFARIAIIGLVVMMTFYGVQMIWSRGEPTIFGKAKKGFSMSVVGALVIFGAYTIVATAAYAAGAKIEGFTVLTC